MTTGEERLAAFIRSRLAEDEARAWAVHDVEQCDALLYEADMADAAQRDFFCDCGMPARSVRGITAKRAILSIHRNRFATLLALASEWPDHPDYDPEWGAGWQRVKVYEAARASGSTEA